MSVKGDVQYIRATQRKPQSVATPRILAAPLIIPPFCMPGVVVPFSNSGRWYAPADMVVTSVFASVDYPSLVNGFQTEINVCLDGVSFATLSILWNAYTASVVCNEKINAGQYLSAFTGFTGNPQDLVVQFEGTAR